MPKQSATSGKRLKAAENRNEVLRLRRAGLSYTEVAKRAELSRGQCCKIVLAEMEKLAKDAEKETQELRQLEMLRLDDMQVGLWPAVLEGDVKAVNGVIRIMERRAKMCGLDQPTKIAPTSPDGENEYAAYSDADLVALLKKVTGD